MRIENKPKSISKNKTLVGAFFSNAGTFINGTIKKYFGIDIGLDTTNFDKNLDNTISDVQKLADAVDELVIPDAQIQSDWNQTNNTLLDFIKNKPEIPTLPAGTENQTIRKGASAWEATDILKVIADQFTNRVEINVSGNGYSQCLVNGDRSSSSPVCTITRSSYRNAKYVDFLSGTPDSSIIKIGRRNMPYPNVIEFYDDHNMAGIYLHSYYGAPELDECKIGFNGSYLGTKYKKSSSGVTNQFNNIVVDEFGNFEKQQKNIGILLADQLIDSATLVEVPNCSTKPMRTNYYHCEFRIILRRLMGTSIVDVFRNSGLQFKFTNNGANEIEILGGIRYQYQYQDGVNDDAVGGAYDCMNFAYIIDNAGFALNSTYVAEYLIVDGSFTFLQATDNDNLKLYIAKVTDAEDYTIEKGSFVKITLKNED